MDKEETLTLDQSMEATMRKTMDTIKAQDTTPTQTTDTKPVDVDDNAVKPPVVDKTDKPTDGRQRDATGKFKAAAEKAAPDGVVDNTGQSADEASTQKVERKDTPPAASAAPSSWPDAAKAEWNAIPPVVRQQVHKREMEVDRAMRSSAERVKRFEAIEKVIEPHRDFFTMHYGSVEKGINDLMALNDIAVKDPRKFVALFCSMRGINPAEIQQGQQAQAYGQQPQGHAYADPNVAALLNRVQSLESSIKTQNEAEQQRVNQMARQTYEEFAANPENKYLEDVSQDMADLLEKGLAASYQDAYDKACHIRPDIREKIWSDKQEQAEKARREAAEKQAKDARRAATHADVTRPNAGATPSQPKSWEDTLKANHERILRGNAA